jgi:CDP-glucose 4,6-dehydratase
VAVDAAFWEERRVLVTGHTGFKGTWLTLWLRRMGAEVIGVSKGVPTTPSLYELTRAREGITEVWADVRDMEAIREAVALHTPEVVIHMGAQAFVRGSLHDPRATYEVNVMGTVNVLEAVRTTPGVRVVVNVTSDKCYDNRDGGRPLREGDPLGGADPYSSSKGCAELVAGAYLRSFFAPDPKGPRLGSARAGNVIGGGDWGRDRLVPDIMRAAVSGEVVRIRNPESIRPWQHVLNPLSGYLELAQALDTSPDYQGSWNFGPAADDSKTVGAIVRELGARWSGGLRSESDPGPRPEEARVLALDSTKARERLGWKPAWDLDDALDAIVAWYAAVGDGDDARAVTLAQIEAFGGA